MATNVGISFRFCKVRSRVKSEATKAGERRENPHWKPDAVGNGSYATVYRVEEIIDSGKTKEGERKAVCRPAVAKVCKDDAPPDAKIVFGKEVEVLSELANLDDVISLRGVVDQLPPTFVCGAAECSDPDLGIFTVTECPTCKEKGQAGSLLTNGQRTNTLQCRRNEEHIFAKHNDLEYVALTKNRPCGHADAPVSEINFTFRPCILLDEFDVNLDEFAKLTSGARVRNVQLAAVRRDTKEQVYELLIQRLHCLTRVACGLADVHERKRAHLDLHPSNVMLRVSQANGSSDGQPASRLGRLHEPHTRLIDFGKSRPLSHRSESEDSKEYRQARSSSDTVALERRGSVFCAPEQREPIDRIDVTWIRPWDHAEGAVVKCSEEGILWVEPGDRLYDDDKGQYEVVSAVPDESGSTRIATLKVIVPPSRANRIEPPADMNWWRAPGEASDIYSLGSLICWLISGGRKEMLSHLQANLRAHKRAIQSDDVQIEAWVPMEKDREIAYGHVGLPVNDSRAEQINRQLFNVILRCWHRGQYGLCAGRSEVGTNAAAKVALELNDIREQAIVIHRELRLGSPLAEWRTDEIVERLRREAGAAHEAAEKLKAEVATAKMGAENSKQAVESIRREAEEAKLAAAEAKRREDEARLAREVAKREAIAGKQESDAVKRELAGTKAEAELAREEAARAAQDAETARGAVAAAKRELSAALRDVEAAKQAMTTAKEEADAAKAAVSAATQEATAQRQRAEAASEGAARAREEADTAQRRVEAASRELEACRNAQEDLGRVRATVGATADRLRLTRVLLYVVTLSAMATAAYLV